MALEVPTHSRSPGVMYESRPADIFGFGAVLHVLREGCNGIDFGDIVLDLLSPRRFQNQLFYRFICCIDFWSFLGPMLGSFWEAFGGFGGQHRSFWASILG